MSQNVSGIFLQLLLTIHESDVSSSIVVDLVTKDEHEDIGNCSLNERKVAHLMTLLYITNNCKLLNNAINFS